MKAKVDEVVIDFLISKIWEIIDKGYREYLVIYEESLLEEELEEFASKYHKYNRHISSNRIKSCIKKLNLFLYDIACIKPKKIIGINTYVFYYGKIQNIMIMYNRIIVVDRNGLRKMAFGSYKPCDVEKILKLVSRKILSIHYNSNLRKYNGWWGYDVDMNQLLNFTSYCCKCDEIALNVGIRMFNKSYQGDCQIVKKSKDTFRFRFNILGNTIIISDDLSYSDFIDLIVYRFFINYK